MLVMRGGKIFLMKLMGQKEKNNSRMQQTQLVPSIAPYATSPSMPICFCCWMPISKMGKNVKLHEEEAVQDRWR